MLTSKNCWTMVGLFLMFKLSSFSGITSCIDGSSVWILASTISGFEGICSACVSISLSGRYPSSAKPESICSSKFFTSGSYLGSLILVVELDNSYSGEYSGACWSFITTALGDCSKYDDGLIVVCMSSGMCSEVLIYEDSCSPTFLVPCSEFLILL